jgi:hypothetical protein
MAISKSELENLIYRKYEIGTAHVSNLRQPDASEKEFMDNVVSELLGYVLAKHS